jgi:Ser/Thr protein kinase RdoA (MazF antagonist)
MTTTPSSHPFDDLTPDVILDAVEQQGWQTSGHFLALNSYENRVYQIGVEDGTPIIAKFYRPGRWSDAQILEEHAYTDELLAQELPVVAPLRDNDGNSLFHHGAFRFSLFPRRGGHAPPLDDDRCLETLGRWMARFHNVGAVRGFSARPALTIDEFGHQAVKFVGEHFVPKDLLPSWQSITRDLLAMVTDRFAAGRPITPLRAHGDCHPGNVLWRDHAPHFIDLDDARMAPSIQDLWMLLSGDRDQQQRQLGAILDGYQDFREFDCAELRLIEPLRTLRMLHFAGWIGQRWDDPAFPRAFPWFNSPRYWGDMILDLRMQMSSLQEPALLY